MLPDALIASDARYLIYIQNRRRGYGRRPRPPSATEERLVLPFSSALAFDTDFQHTLASHPINNVTFPVAHYLIMESKK